MPLYELLVLVIAEDELDILTNQARKVNDPILSDCVQKAKQIAEDRGMSLCAHNI